MGGNFIGVTTIDGDYPAICINMCVCVCALGLCLSMFGEVFALAHGDHTDCVCACVNCERNKEN